MNEKWDDIYKSKMGSFTLSMDRTLQRDKYFYQSLHCEIANKTILDFGCGDSRHVLYYLDPIKENFRYIGFDYSKPSLKLFPVSDNVNFIQFNANKIPVKKDSADIIISFGLLMYFQNYQEIMDNYLEILKPGGKLFLYDPLKKMNSPVKNSFVDLDRLKEIIMKKADIRFERRDYSPIRYILVKIANSLKLAGNKTVMKIIITIDSITIMLLGSYFKLLDGRAVFMRIEKR